MTTKTSQWTHRSITKFPGAADPISFIVTRAREATMSAMESGWAGPPFDPVQLAQHLGIAVEPREDIPDARTVPAGPGRIKIEFNPNRPRGRMRFSIAHEIAHTFFPDCADQTRNRAGKTEMSGDDWQLEMLCNIAAAELIMPIGSFPDLGTRPVSIDDLMALRRDYDVSIEALLLRFIRLTSKRCALFAASRAEKGAYEGRYRLDYAVASSEWKHPVPLGQYLREGSIVTDCTAIGFTAKGEDVWPTGQCLHVECVGTPPFPGSVYPRVLGLVVDPDDSPASTHAIRCVHGDALHPRGTQAAIIAHVVNDRSLTWGGGFAKQVAINYPEAQIEFRRWGHEPGHQKLGQTHFYGSAKRLEIASMVAQQGFGASDTPRIRYPALELCLRSVAERAIAHGAAVHMPRIGCGQAGGKWEVVSELVDREMARRGISVTVYDLPPKARSPR